MGEVIGAKIGDDLVITGGFLPGFNTGAQETFLLYLAAHYNGGTVGWVQMDNNPIDPGFWTHAAHAVDGNQLYFCGGYLGANPGPEMRECYVFDKTSPSGQQWTGLPFLPAGRGKESERCMHMVEQ